MRKHIFVGLIWAGIREPLPQIFALAPAARGRRILSGPAAVFGLAHFVMYLQKFISICATWLRSAVPLGFSRPSPMPFTMPCSLAQAMA